jgi:hypothetical protein
MRRSALGRPRQDGPPWDYNGGFDLRQTGSGWKVVWSTSVINPGLRPACGWRWCPAPRAGHCSRTPRRPLQLPSAAYVVGVRPDRLTHPEVTVARLGRITKLDPTQLLGFILAAPRSSFQELVVLRPAQYNRMASRLARVPGLIIKRAAPAVQQHRPGRGRVGGHRDLQHPA